MAKLSNINGKFAVEDTGAIRFSDQTGTTGQILKSNGNSAPTWVDPNTVGTGPWLPLAGGVVSGPTTFQSSLTVGGLLTGANATFNGLMKLDAGGILQFAANTTTPSMGVAIHRSAADTLNFVTASTNRLTIDDDGNVGIGIDTPTLVAGKIVHIHGVAAGVHLTDTASGTTSGDGGYVAFDNPNLYIQNKEAGSMFFETSGTTALTIDSDGDATFAGNVTSNFQATTSSGSININSSDPTIRFNRVGGTTDKSIYELRAIAVGGTNDYFQLRKWNDAQTVASELMKIDNSGNTTFTGDVRISKTDATLQINNSTATLTNADLYISVEDTGQADVRQYGAYPLAFWTNNTERVRINSNGNLNLLNATSTDSKHFGITNAAGTTGWTFGNGVIANSHQFVIYDNTAGAARMLINSSGNVGIGITPFAHTLGTSASLDLKGNGGIWGYAGATYVNSNAYYDSGWKYKTTAPAAVLQVGGSSQELTFRQAVSGTAGNAITYTQPFTIDTSGKVGIGRTAPDYKLVISNNNAEGIEFGPGYISGCNLWQNYNRTTSTYVKETHYGSEYHFLPAGGATGNVGIGVTSPTHKLHVYSAVPTGGIGLKVESGNVTNWIQNKSTGSSWQIGSTGSGFQLYNDDTSSYRFIVENGGNVGIGTTSPETQLSIGDYTDSTETITIATSSNGTGRINFYDNNNTEGGSIRVVGELGGSKMYFSNRWNTDNDRVVFDLKNGNVGLGTTSLGTISGSCSAMTFGSTHNALSGGVMFQANGTNVNGTYWESNNMRYQNIGDFSHTFYKNNTTVLFTIATTGTVTAVGNVVAYSDKKLKKNIKTLDGSKVYEMRGVSFDRIDTNKASSGVIAQEIQQVAPELIDKSKDGTLGVAYGNLTGYLIEAIKELKAEIELLKNK